MDGNPRQLVKKKATLVVRQLRTGHIQDLIFHIMDGSNTEARKIDEVRIRPAKRQAYEYIFSNGKLTDHAASFDYYTAKPLTHTLEFTFKSVRLHSKEDHAISGTVEV